MQRSTAKQQAKLWESKETRREYMIKGGKGHNGEIYRDSGAMLVEIYEL